VEFRLANVAEVISGYTFRERLDAYADGDVAVIQMKNMDTENRLQTGELPRVELADLSDRQLLREGDLIFRSRGLFYTAAAVTSSLGRAVAAAPLMVIRLSSPRLLPEYLRWFINHPSTQATLSALGAGTHVRTLNKVAIESLVIPVPSLERQRSIAELDDLGKREKVLASRIAEQRARVLEEILARHARNTR
jgi:hypothetical protein